MRGSGVAADAWVCALCLQALANNHMPYRDQGIEVLYRFASFDPFLRSNYFGCVLLPCLGCVLGVRCCAFSVLGGCLG